MIVEEINNVSSPEDDSTLKIRLGQESLQEPGLVALGGQGRGSGKRKDILIILIVRTQHLLPPGSGGEGQC